MDLTDERKMKPKLVLVDFGGTLLDLIPAHVRCLDEAAEAVLGRPLTTEEHKRVALGYAEGESSWTVVRMAFKESLLPEVESEICLRKRTMIDQYLDSCSLSNDSLNFLMLCVRCTVTAVVSIGKRRPILDLLERSGAAGIDVFGRENDEDVISKPDLIRLAIGHYHVSAHEVLFVGDTEADAAAADVTGVAFSHVGAVHTEP